MSWLTTAGGYQVTLVSGQVVARNAKGKELRSVPPALRDDPTVFGLRQLQEWLTRHTAQVREQVDRWMVRSLPVPASVLRRVWADEVWRTALTDLVVVVGDEVGFLRDATADGVGPINTADGVGLVNLDGETVRVAAETVAVPHPVRLAELDDLREFAADLGVTQSVDQLFRQTWVRPADLDPAKTGMSDYAGGRFKELRHLTARASGLGYPVRGGYAVCRVFEDGRTVEARSWVGADDPFYATETGDLVFVGPDGTSVPLREVGPVAWSEGMRMAAGLYAGRVVQDTTEEAA